MKLSIPEITQMLLALGMLLACARIGGELARRLNQAAVLGEIAAGILLGPTVMGRLFPEFTTLTNPSHGNALFMSGFTTVAVVLFLLIAGMEVDLTRSLRQARSAVLISVSGIVVPFTVGYLAALNFPHLFGYEKGIGPGLFALFFATALSISALPVIAKTLLDLNYYRTDFGIAIISSAIIDDLVGWLIFSVILGAVGINAAGSFSPSVTILLTLLFAAGMLTAGRWAMHRLLPLILAHTSWPGGVLGFAVSLAFLGAAFTEWIGIHAIFGSFMVGVALGDSAHMRKRTKETLEQFVSFIFAPLFFISIGLRLDFAANFDLVLTLLVIAIAFIGKVGGCGAGALMGGMPAREAWAVGFGMNARGAMEIILALLALQHGLIGERMFVALVVMALVTTLASGPMMQLLLRRKKARQVRDYLSRAAFVNPLMAKDGRGAITELSAAVAASAGLDAALVEREVLEREKIVPTGIGYGVAIPHARIKGLPRPLIGVALSRAGVDFNAQDGAPARLIFLILTPHDDGHSQVEILSEISRITKNTELCDRMKNAGGYTELLGLLKTQEI